MRVKHLIAELLKVNQEAEVVTEGCDCFGDTFCVEDGVKGEVEIRRSENFHVGFIYENSQDTPRPWRAKE
jgi:hypothetical protein